jgi:hypothetical protein
MSQSIDRGKRAKLKQAGNVINVDHANPDKMSIPQIGK